MVATNRGPGSANGIEVKGTLPTGSTYLTSSGTGWTINELDGLVTATHGSLPTGETATFKVEINAPAANGKVDFVADLTTTSLDSNPANNTTTVQTDVLGATDLSVSFTDQTDRIDVGGAMTYIVQVTNTGPYNAKNVTAVVTLPAGAVYVSGTRTGWTVGENGGVVTATRLALDVADARRSPSR